MKKLIITGFVLLSGMFSLRAQSPVFKAYYELKETLVNADAVNASVKAAELTTAFNNIDMKAIPEDMQNIFMELKKKLTADANCIAASREIGKQREYFANLSLEFYSLAKQMKLTSQTIYQAYCPMKKMYWLSNEKSIRNPYYGKMMLTCGTVTDIINP